MFYELLCTFILIWVANEIYKLWTKNPNLANMPPGPRGVPILGHLPFLGKNPSLKFLEWKKIYGPIFTVNFGSNRTIILNEAKIVREAWNLESFSGRPILPMFLQFSGSKGISFNEGPRQTEHRKFTLKAFKEFGVGKASTEFFAHEEFSKFEDALKKKLKAGNANPLEIKHMFRIQIMSTFWYSMMNHGFDEKDLSLQNLLHKTEAFFKSTQTVLGQLSWFFPWIANTLSYFNRNKVLKSVHDIYAFMSELIEKQRKGYKENEPRSIADLYFDQVAQTSDYNSAFHKSRQEQPMSTGDIFMGLIDNMPTTMDWIFLYASLNPEMQRKLQAEIDTVKNDNELRVPLLADRGRMPYTDAFINEVYRASSVAPLDFFHRAKEDVEFQNYVIPKNTWVVANLYGIHHDSEFWPEPERFLPERFLDEEGKLNKKSAELVAFASGKRSCIGEGFARDVIFLLTTSFFSKFTICCTENVPSVEPRFDISVTPKPFQVNVSERSE